MKIAAVIVLLVLVVGMAYVRLAASDAARWHKASGLAELGDFAAPGGFTHRRAMAPGAGFEALQKLAEVAQNTPRTQVLAGSVADGMITFVTRSKVFGFPDYTTLSLQGDVLELRARLRFGKSDLGVNRARVVAWLQAAGLTH